VNPKDPSVSLKATATVRLVCSGWKAVHDAVVMLLMLRPETTDEAVGMLARRFPAVVSVEYKSGGWRVLTDQGLRAVSSLPSPTSLNLTRCRKVTDAGLLAVSSLPALTELALSCCDAMTAEGLRAVSNLTGLTKLNISNCTGVTAEGLCAVSNLSALARYQQLQRGDGPGTARCEQPPCTHRAQPPQLHGVKDEGLKALRSLTSLAVLNLRGAAT
jgi:hypothetical protein